MIKTFIIHVSGEMSREKHMIQQLENQNLAFSFLTEGDKKDLSADVLSKYFGGEMKAVSSTTSCAYKHLLACEYLLKTDANIALIFEDDIKLYSNFNKNLPKIIKEIKTKNLNNFILSLEDSDLKYIPKSKRIKGNYIYQINYGTTTAAYIIDRIAAENVLKKAIEEKVKIPIDWFHTECINEGKIKMYRSFPALGSQGTFDGSVQSLISNNRVGWFRLVTYKLQKKYKRFLYNLR